MSVPKGVRCQSPRGARAGGEWVSGIIRFCPSSVHGSKLFFLNTEGFRAPAPGLRCVRTQIDAAASPALPSAPFALRETRFNWKGETVGCC